LAAGGLQIGRSRAAAAGNQPTRSRLQIGGSARVLPELLHHSAFGERATACSVSGCSRSHGPGRLVTRCRRRQRWAQASIVYGVRWRL